VSEEITSYVKVAGLIDIDLELARIQKRSSQLTDLMDKLTKKMAAPSYTERVPEKVRQQDSEKVTGYENELATLASQTANLTKFK
jgi:valyl-tRNA synthetase